MPDCIYRLKSAVRHLTIDEPRTQPERKNRSHRFFPRRTDGRFPRVTNNRPDLEGAGSHPEISSSVQAALIHGNRYNYFKVEPDDPMFKRFEKHGARAIQTPIAGSPTDHPSI